VAEYDLLNSVTNVGKNALRDALLYGIDARIRYVALGTSSSANPAPNTLTQLGAESFRKYLTAQSQGAVGESIATFYVAPQEGNINIQEIGIFGGPLSTAIAGSGTLIARTLWSHTKTTSETVQIDRHDILS